MFLMCALLLLMTVMEWSFEYLSLFFFCFKITIIFKLWCPTFPPAAPELLATVLPPTGSSWCVSMDGQRFANGESWHDGCRHCLCQGGREMCSLIACPILSCLAPKLQPGHCCPSCPGQTSYQFVTFSLEVAFFCCFFNV